jgi:hypothetical protein
MQLMPNLAKKTTVAMTYTMIGTLIGTTQREEMTGTSPIAITLSSNSHLLI